MAYVINKTNGQTLTVIQDGDISSIGGLTFFGKKYPNYGKLQNENFLKLLENFSNSTPPSSPIEGQLWWDNVNKSIKIYDTTQVGGWIELPTVSDIIGTENQITATVSGKIITLSLPQPIHDNANPTFNRLILSQETGASPLTITSTTLVTNLNSDLLDGQQGSYYLNYNNFTNKPTIGSGVVKIEGANGLTGVGQFDLNQTNNSTITISHDDTSTVENINNTNGNVLRSMSFDTYGHVIGTSSVDLDARYYTKSLSDSTFLKTITLASNSVVGGIKIRLSGNTLYIRNDGTNA